jgi:hypothetical protein
VNESDRAADQQSAAADHRVREMSVERFWAVSASLCRKIWFGAWRMSTDDRESSAIWMAPRLLCLRWMCIQNLYVTTNPEKLARLSNLPEAPC